jgi:OmpR family response regulator RpaB
MNKNKAVLIVEDDEMMRNVLVDRLSESALTLFQAGDGGEAIELCLVNRPDLILLDLLLPKLDGYGVMEQLRNNVDKAIALTPIIIFSNFEDSEHVTKAQAFSNIEYYVKNKTSVDNICSRVNEILRESKI